MTRDQINQLWTESTTVADFLIAIGVVKVDEMKPEPPKIPKMCGPFFVTQWEREDYEREQRGEKPLGPR